MSDNTFLKPAEYYQRNINPIGQYVDQSAFYLSKMSGKSLDACKSFVINGIKTKKFNKAVDPIVEHFERTEVGDRAKHSVPLSKYIGDVVKSGEILVPTFTSYVPPSQEKSLLSEFIGENVKIRSKSKHEAQEAEAAGNHNLYVAKNNEQANMKTYNNSMSGAFAAEGSVLQNPTGHNTLTSITRTMASIGNSLNERIIAGNRHYRNPDVTLYDINAVASTADYALLQQCMDFYKLHYPTVGETIAVITYSTECFYWKDKTKLAEIETYVAKLSPLERAAFVYSQDLYHVRKFNPEFMRNFLERFSDKTIRVNYDNPAKLIKSTHPLVVNYAQQVCLKEVRGKDKDHSKHPIEDANVVANVCVNIDETVRYFKLFIDALFLTRLVPAGTAYIPSMVRRSVVLSDTDSTMFSVDDWVRWYFGELVFHDRAFAIAGAVMFFSTQCIAHSLAILSANMGVAREHLFTLSMKPEFVFPVFAQTNVAKHYFTCVLIKEGFVYPEMKLEVKGVNLKNSAAPKSIVTEGQAKMMVILKDIMANRKISILDQIGDVAALERKITKSVLNGEDEFYKKSKVKTPEAYTQGPLRSMYQHHNLWETVFEPKYGKVQPPPYGVIKIPTTLLTPSLTKKFVTELKDRDLAARFVEWMVRHNKKKLPTMYLSTDYVAACNIPEEIKGIINLKKILLDLTGMNRMILESVGFPTKKDWLFTEMGY